MPLFKKAACFTDIHFGMKGGSRTHNMDCEEFVKWFCDEAKAAGAETCIFLGDWHHNRATTDVSTMNYTVSNLERINETFEKTYFMVGNHDLFYKDKREINSIEFMRLFPNIIPITDVFTEGEVTLLPWLVGEEWKMVPKIKSRYVFGHFELPLFYMNAMVQMPDHGELKADHFKHQEYVFSGHFHKRQKQGHVHYLGNAFPHNYADAGDDARGMMILDKENNAEPLYINWDDCPKYRNTTLSKLLDPTSSLVKPKMHLRVTLDIPISFEEAGFLKETYIKQYNCREITLISQRQTEEINTDLDISQFASVDQIVSNEISQLDTENYSKKTLLDIYNGLQ